MSGFDKDDYLRDLPDPDDPMLRAPSAAASDGSLADSRSRFEPTGEQEVKMSDDNVDENQNAAEAESAASGDCAGDAAGQESVAETTQDETASTEGDGQGEGVSEEGDTLTPLGQAKKEAAEYLDALQRERAEFVNFRNRSQKEQSRFREHGIIDVLTALLPALDDIDRIREHSEMDESFTAVAAKIDKAFEKFGVEKFGEKGEEFDPTRHEAVLHRPDAQATCETVDAVVEAGYRIGDRVIRAARVVVASPQA